MSRKMKIGFVIAVFIIGFSLVFLEKVSMTEFGAFLGGFAAIGISVEKWIEPKKEQKIKDDIKSEL